RAQARQALEIEVARGPRRRTREREPHGGALDPHLFDLRRALCDFEADREQLERRLAAAEVAPAGQRVALEPPEHLLEIDPADGATLAGQADAAVQSLRQLVDVAARALEIADYRPLALQTAQSDEFAQALVEVDVGELKVGPDRSTRLGLGKAERTTGDAAEGLRFSDRDGQVATAQIGSDCGSSELDMAKRNPGSRQSQIHVEAGQTRKRDRLPTPVVAGEQPEPRQIGRQVDRLGGQRALQALPPGGG